MASRTVLVLAVVGLMQVGLIGCSDALFPKDAPRSPYSRYSDLRGRGAAAEDLDAYGRPRPALRERLMPLELR